MLRETPTIVALALGTASAFAQPASNPAAAPGDATAARTLEQNRRVLIGQPAPSGSHSTAAEAGARAALGDRAGGAATGGIGRVDLTAGGRAGARQQLSVGRVAAAAH